MTFPHHDFLNAFYAHSTPEVEVVEPVDEHRVPAHLQGVAFGAFLGGLVVTEDGWDPRARWAWVLTQDGRRARRGFYG